MPLGQREVAGGRGFRAKFFSSLYTSKASLPKAFCSSKGALFAEGWLAWKPHCGQTQGCHLSAGPTPCSECPGPHAVVLDMGCDSCGSCISLHSADPGSRQQTSPGSCVDV